MERLNFDKFLLQVQAERSIAFPSIARAVNLDWFNEVLPYLEANATELTRLQNVLKEMKFELLNNVLKVARDGKVRAGINADVNSVKFIIQMIDSGAVLGDSSKAIANGQIEPTDEQVNDLMKRMGIKDETNV